MIFGIVVILLVGLVAYFHYMQGLLAGVISAVCAAVAAALALGFHENVIDMIAQGKMADQTHALVLVGMFALIYLILRIIFDKLIPGNVRFPAIADKIGGALMGLIAGVFAIGILVIAAQTLPFGPSIAGYARWELEDREVKIPSAQGGVQQDSKIFDEMKATDPIKPDDRGAGMILPVDDMVVNFVNKLSDGGSLAGERSLASVHPAYNDESFFQRLGIQLGGKHVAMNTPKLQQAKVDGVYFIQQVPQGEAEIPNIRQRENLKPLTSTSAQAILVVRVEFADNATDSDKRVRLAPVGVRLVANGKNYFPEGTLDSVAGVVYANKPDDFLLIEPNQPVDFVFKVDRGDVLAAGGKDKAMEIAAGVFVEIKRLVRANLGGKKVSDVVDSVDSGVIRKAESQASKVQGVSLHASAPAAAPAAAVTPTPPPAAPATTNAPAASAPAPNPPAAPAPTAPADSGQEKGAFKFAGSSTGGKLFAPVSVGKEAAESTDDLEQELHSGKALIKAKKIARLELHKGDETLQEVGTGTGKITALYIPPSMMMVQVNGTALAADPWRWAEHLSKIEIVDDKNGRYKPSGALARATKDSREYFIGKFDFETPPDKIDKEDCTPTAVHLFFLVPEKTVIKSMSYDGEKMTDLTISGS